MTELVTGDYSAEDGKSSKEEMDAENLGKEQRLKNSSLEPLVINFA